MQFSIGCEYAVHGLLFLAMRNRDDVVFVSDIARAQNLPESYLAKVFQLLAKAGLLRSYRGAKGGYSLALRPDEITLRDVTMAIEGQTPLFKPQSAKRSCSFAADCLIREAFGRAEKSLFSELEKVTLQEMVDRVHQTGDHLKWLDLPQTQMASSTTED
jgi:Rrf2 family protein